MAGDLTSARLMYVKAGLFVVLGGLASAGILVECPSWRVAGLLTLAVWAFARAYYFAFYVVGRWIDPAFRFAGLAAFGVYVWKRWRAGGTSPK